MPEGKPSPKLLRMLSKSFSSLPSIPTGRFKKIDTSIKKKIIYNIINTFIFSIIYYVISKYNSKAFSEINIKYTQLLYFSATTNFTLGFGDILPISSLAKFFVIVQSIIFYTITIIP